MKSMDKIIRETNDLYCEEFAIIEEAQYLALEQIKIRALKTLHQDDINEILKCETEQGMIKFHSSIGKWLRNEFLMWDVDNPQLKGYHADDFSFEVLKSIWRAVQHREMIGL